MGYRSRVIIAFHKDLSVPIEVMKVLGDAEVGVSDDGTMVYEYNDVKWYDSFDEVRTVNDFISSLEEEEYRFVRIGEDINDIDDSGYIEDGVHISVYTCADIDLYGEYEPEKDLSMKDAISEMLIRMSMNETKTAKFKYLFHKIHDEIEDAGREVFRKIDPIEIFTTGGRSRSSLDVIKEAVDNNEEWALRAFEIVPLDRSIVDNNGLITELANNINEAVKERVQNGTL